jgi:hypothetical protein
MDIGTIRDGARQVQASGSSTDDAFADISRRDYESYLKDYRGFEQKILNSRNDTSLIDQSREDAKKQAGMVKGIQERNISRYGGAGLSNAQISEQGRQMQRGVNLGTVGGVNLARTAQRDINQATITDLIGIGQGMKSSALSALQDSSQLASQQRQAYSSAKAQHKANMMGTGAQLGSAALMFFAL